MMVKKMQEAAEEKKIEAEIWAVGDADAVNLSLIHISEPTRH